MIFDGWLNANPPEWGVPELHRETLTRVFPKGMRELAEKGWTIDDLLGLMDGAGVDAGMLTTLPELYEDMDDAVEYMAKARDDHPDRFLIGAGVDPRKGMEAVRQVERWVRDYDVRLIRVIPYWIGLPPSHGIYYPIYAKCIEMGVPIGVNIGLPGPKKPGWVQEPLHLDEVCLHFPELPIIGSHMGFPWQDMVVSLMVRHENLHLMTSAWSPKHYPESIKHHMNSRGIGRVLWASDYPALTIERAIDEVDLLDLKPEARQQFVCDAAVRLFRWGR